MGDIPKPMRYGITIMALLLLASCRDTRIEQPGPVGTRNKVWPDVPQVRGFSYEERGEQTPDQSIRVSRITQKGTRSLEDVVEFYRQVLPEHDWELVEERGTPPDPVTLAYTKDKEKLTFDAKREAGETIVEMKIGPK